MDFTGAQGVVLAIIVAILVLTAMILVFRYKRKTPPVGRTRFGFFIERDYDHHVKPDEQITREWPKQQ